MTYVCQHEVVVQGVKFCQDFQYEILFWVFLILGFIVLWKALSR